MQSAQSLMRTTKFLLMSTFSVVAWNLKITKNFASNLENVKYTVNTRHLKMETSEYWTFCCLVFRWSVFSDARSIIIARADKLIRYSDQHLNSGQVVQYHSDSRQHLSFQYSDAIWLKDHTRQVHYPGPHCIVGIQKRLRIWTPGKILDISNTISNHLTIGFSIWKLD